jgi:hypothetical protein
MRHFTLVASLLLLAAPLHAAEMLPTPVATAGITDTPPTIDGALDDPCWRSAVVLRGFVKLDGSTLYAPDTEARVCWDAERLYVGVRCSESQMKSIKVEMKDRDDRVWRDDCVEIFIDANHDRSSYYHFIVNAIGTVYDERQPGNADWDGDVQAAGSRGEGEWVAEMSIALADLGGVKAGDLWGFNIARERHATGGTELSAWSPTYGKFLVPERFGELVLAEQPTGCRWELVDQPLFGPCEIALHSARDVRPTLSVQRSAPAGIGADWDAPEPTVAATDQAAGELPHNWSGTFRIVDGAEEALVIEQRAGGRTLFRQAIPISITPRSRLPQLARSAAALQERIDDLPDLSESLRELVADAGAAVTEFVQGNLQRAEPMGQREWATAAASQTALLTRIGGLSCVVWTQSPLLDVERGGLPPDLQPDPTIRLTACGNEIESGVINITNLAGSMFEGRLTMGDLRLASGEGVDAEGDNLLTNSDFAIDADEDNVPDGWGSTSREGVWALEEQADGSNAFVLSGEGATSVNFRQAVDLTAGTMYTLIAEMSAQDLPGGAGYLHVINNGWTWAKTISPLTPNSAWQRYVISFEAPQSDSFQIVLRLEGRSGGAIRYHDIRLVEGGVEEVTFASECIAFHQAEYQELRLGRTVCDPLPEMNEARVVRVAPGETRQVFLNVDTAALPPGDYTAGLLLRPDDRELPQQSIPLRLQVLPVRLPERMPIATFNWDYARNERYVEDLAAHHTNSYLIGTHPRMRFDDEGNVTGEADWSSHDRLLQVKLRHARANGGIIVFSYGIVRDFHNLMRARHGWEFMSEPWERAFRAWVAEFERHLREDIGMSHDEYAVQIWDEATHSNAELALRGGQLCREVVPQMRLCMDGAQNPEEVRLLDPVVDLWIPHQSALYNRAHSDELREIYREIAEAGEPVWTYTCSTNMKSLSPLDYYRLKEWRVWDLGVGGSCYWAYNSWRGDPWDDFDGTIADCGSIYNGPDRPITSRRWEATRDGREDYKAMHLLREISRMQGAEAADRVEALTDSLVAEVLTARDDLAVFERARKRLLEVLVAYCGEGVPPLAEEPQFAWTDEGLRVRWAAEAMTEGVLRYRVPGDARWRVLRFEEADAHEATITDLPAMRDVQWYLLWWDQRGATGAELSGLRNDGWARTAASER